MKNESVKLSIPLLVGGLFLVIAIGAGGIAFSVVTSALDSRATYAAAPSQLVDTTSQPTAVDPKQNSGSTNDSTSNSQSDSASPNTTSPAVTQTQPTTVTTPAPVQKPAPAPAPVTTPAPTVVGTPITTYPVPRRTGAS